MLEPRKAASEPFPRSLRKERKAAFRREIVPYFRYVFQSGFGLFVSAIFFAFLIWYTDFIKAVPEAWPVKETGVALLFLMSIRTPLRTYLRPADPIFLLAMEDRMLDAYIAPSLKKGIATSVFCTIAAFALYWPIYSRSPETSVIAENHPFIALAVLFALLSGFNAFGGWTERRLADRSRRLGTKLARWALTGLVVAGLLLKPLLASIGFMLVCVAAMTIVYRLPAKHALPWERLIEEEAGARRRWMAFLSWFVDIPTETAKPAYRRWIAWAGDLFPWQRKWAWHYLYAKVFLRGETFGALWRWVLITCLVVAVSGNALADAIVFGVSAVVCGLQLSELRRVRFVETADTLPIEPERRPAAAATLARSAGIAAVLIVGIFGAATVAIGGSSGGDAVAPDYWSKLKPDYWLTALVFGLLWCGWWMPRRIAKYKGEDDD